MMFRICLLLTIFFFLFGLVENKKTCAKSNCDIFAKLEKDKYARNINDNMFAISNSLKLKHRRLKKVLKDLGEDLEVGEDMPLHAYLIKHQKFFHEDIKKLTKRAEMKLETMVDTISLHISQSINNVEMSLTKKMDSHLKKIDYLSEDIKKRVDDAEVELTKKIEQKAIDLKTWTKKECNKKENTRPNDCLDLLLDHGKTTSGVYTIFPQGIETKVLCDMETDGGGWTVFLNRKKQKTPEHFNRNWQAYKDGFGTPPNEYWMGNEALHVMTTSKEYVMRAEASHSQGSPTNTWSEWGHFKVESEDLKYRLSLSQYDTNSSMPNDRGFGYNSGQYFSTVDRDNDNRHFENCANRLSWTGGFWYDGDGRTFCSYVHPTEYYGNIQFDKWSTIQSKKIKAHHLQLKLRPRI